MKMISEFKAFAMKGNVIELAIGVVIGAAFGKIISSLIDDVITPLILKPALEAAKITEIDQLVAFGGVKYGVFISSLINLVKSKISIIHRIAGCHVRQNTFHFYRLMIF